MIMNLNDQIIIRPTKEGVEIYRKYCNRIHEHLNAKEWETLVSKCEVGKEWKLQLHEFISIFGDSIKGLQIVVCEDNNFLVPKREGFNDYPRKWRKNQ